MECFLRGRSLDRPLMIQSSLHLYGVIWRRTAAEAPLRYVFVDFFVVESNKTIMIFEFFILALEIELQHDNQNLKDLLIWKTTR